jgi:hypothetical protein
MCQNVTRTCERLRKSGTEVYSVSIETDEPMRLYGKEYSLYVESIEAIGPKFFQFFSKILINGRLSR